MNHTELVARELLENLKRAGYPIGITSGYEFDTVPVFQDVKYPGSTVEHLGFGFFRMKTPKGEITFDGGGAMHRVYDDDNWLCSWTFFRGDAAELAECGLVVENQIAELEKIVGG